MAAVGGGMVFAFVVCELSSSLGIRGDGKSRKPQRETNNHQPGCELEPSIRKSQTGRQANCQISRRRWSRRLLNAHRTFSGNRYASKSSLEKPFYWQSLSPWSQQPDRLSLD